MSQGMLTPDDVESLKVYRRRKVNDTAKVTINTRYGPLKVRINEADFYGLV